MPDNSTRGAAGNPAALRVIHVMGALDGEVSGPDRIAASIANGLARRGVSNDIYACGAKVPQMPSEMLQPPTRCVTAPGWWLGGLAYSPQLQQMLDRAVRDSHVVHQHSIWMLPNHYAAAAARRHGKPYLYLLNGNLEPQAVQRSRWKKRIVRCWFQDRDLRAAACLQVNTEAELGGVRAYGLTNPVAVIRNGVDLPAADPTLPATFFTQYPRLQGKRLCLFLSRLHHKKGLQHLLPAWARLRSTFPDWHLLIVGPDYGMESQVRGAVDALQLSDAVTLAGPLIGRMKRAAQAAAEVFVLPSFHEGFSMAVLEALAAGLPVLITPGCNFPEVAAAGAGLIVPPTVEDTEGGLRELLAQTPADLAARGMRGRELASRSYSWDDVAARLEELYAWILHGGHQPSFVETAGG